MRRTCQKKKGDPLVSVKIGAYNLGEYCKAQSALLFGLQHVASAAEMKWTALQTGCIKINTDVSFKMSWREDWDSWGDAGWP
jgi:hypothetical protein